MGINDVAVLLSPQQLAWRWSCSEKTLQRWRTLGIGPVFVKLGGRVMYPVESVVSHERKHRRNGTASQKLYAEQS